MIEDKTQQKLTNTAGVSEANTKSVVDPDRKSKDYYRQCAMLEGQVLRFKQQNPYNSYQG